jgi:hypothetical protein
MGEMANVYKVLVGKPKGKRAFRRSGIYGRIILECVS